MNGEFSLSGIAERVAKAFKQDSGLANISTVYVAQEDDAIILTGTVSDVSCIKTDGKCRQTSIRSQASLF